MKGLTSLSQEEKERLGVVHTPQEIAQQPNAWRKMGESLLQQRENLAAWLGSAPSPFILTGAGTSEYVARCVAPILRSGAGLDAAPVPTTEIVIDPRGSLPKGPCTLVSFARSGNSPESIAAVDLVNQLLPGSRHLAVTCNAEGALAKGLRGSDDGYVLDLPPETNDRSLAMTSSYSTLTLAGMSLGILQTDLLETWIDQLATAAERVLSEEEESAKRVADLDFDRAVFIGGGPHYGTALEGHLKLQELTDGQVVCKSEGTLGLRHGPMAVIHEKTLIVMFLSSDPYARLYDLDLLREIRAKQLGVATVVIGDGLADVEGLGDLADTLIDVKLPKGHIVSDALRAPLYIVWPQMLAVYTSLRRGLKPDTPSAGGVINRVVEGVHIHPFE